MRCATVECSEDATHEVVRKRVSPSGTPSAQPAQTDFFCDTCALEVWRTAGYASRVLPLYALAGASA